MMAWNVHLSSIDCAATGDETAPANMLTASAATATSFVMSFSIRTPCCAAVIQYRQVPGASSVQVTSTRTGDIGRIPHGAVVRLRGQGRLGDAETRERAPILRPDH